MATVATRIPEEVLAEAKQIAAMRGTTSGAVIAQAWMEFVERHRAAISDEFAQVSQMMRDGDRAGLKEHLRASREKLSA